MITDRKKIAAIAIFALAIALFAFVYSTSITVTNGTNGTNAVLGTLTFALHNTSSDVTAYTSLTMNSVIVADVPKTYRFINGTTNGDNIIANFTSPAMNLTLIPAGAIAVHIHASKVDGIAHDDSLWFDVGTVNSTGGNFSSMGLSIPSTQLIKTSETEFDLSGVMLERSVNTTDRMLLRIYAHQVGTGGLPDITIYMDDLTVSRLTIPAIPIDLTSLINQVSTNQINIDTKVNKSGDTWTGTMFGYPIANPGVFNTIDMETDPLNICSTDSTNLACISIYPNNFDMNADNGVGTSSDISVLPDQIRMSSNLIIVDAPLQLANTYMVGSLNLSGNNLTECGNCNWVNKSGDNMTGTLKITDANALGSVLNVTQRSSTNNLNPAIKAYSNGVMGLILVNTASSSSSQGAGIVATTDDGAQPSIGDRLGFMLFGAATDATHLNVSNSAGFSTFATQTWTASARGTDFHIQVTANGSTTRTDRVVIDQNGNITMSKYAGSGVALACFDSNGVLYRGTSTTC